MTKQETAKIMSVIKTAYPRYYANADMKSALELWSVMLADYEYSLIAAAVKAVIATSKFPPAVADVLEKVNMLTIPQSMNEAEAWEKVRRAISNSGYNSAEEFDKLPEECKAVVCAPEQLKVWAMMNEDEVNTVVASNFQRAYRTRNAKREEYNALPKSVRDMLKGVTQMMLEEQHG